jgi:hypothetical protein
MKKRVSKYSRLLKPVVSPYISEEIIKEYIPSFNKEDFLNKAYDVFVNVQFAVTKFDYNSLKKYLSNELYNKYDLELRTLSTKNRQHVINNIQKQNMGILGIKEYDNQVELTVELKASLLDYVIEIQEFDDQPNINKLINGQRYIAVTTNYQLTFICNKKNYLLDLILHKIETKK